MEQITRLDEILTKVKQKEGKNYTTFSDLRKRLGKGGCKLFGLKEDDKSVASMEKALQPYLGGAFMILKGSKTSFLAFKLPIDEIVFEALKNKFQKGGLFAPWGGVGKNLPMKKDDFVASFIRLFEAGRVFITLDVNLNVKVRDVKTDDSSTPTRPSPPPAVSPPVPPQDDRKLFRDAFDQLDRGRIFVRICNLRRKLGWSEERFNSLLRKLRSECIIQLHAGDVSSMTEDDIAQSFTDENNFFYATLTMKPRQQ